MSIFRTLQFNLGSVYVNDFNILGRVYRVVAQAEASNRKDIADIYKLKVPNDLGQNVPLGSVVTINRIMNGLEYIQKKPQEINEKCVRIKQIEHDVDDLYEQFMSDVFANEKDAIELVKLKNIGQVLEDATDRAKDVGDIVRGIIIKFA